MNLKGETRQAKAMRWDDFYDLVTLFTGAKYYPEYVSNEIRYYDNDGEGKFNEEEFYAWIARNYHGIDEVTSIHADNLGLTDIDEPTVWIVFKPTAPTASEYACRIMTMLNGGLSSQADLVAAMMLHHRTLQQLFTRLCREWINANASAPDTKFDGRNEATQKWAKALKPISDTIPLPYI